MPLTTRLTIHTVPDHDSVMWSLLQFSGFKPNHVRMELQEFGSVSRYLHDAAGYDLLAQLLARAARQEA